MALKFGLQLLAGLFAVIIAGTASGSQDVFFPLSLVQLTIPQTPKTIKLFTKIPFGKFSVISQSTDFNVSDFIYKLENSQDFLQINSRSGDVFLGPKYPQLTKMKKFVLSVQNIRRKGATNGPRMTIEINPISEKDFCGNLENLCFWERAWFSLVEDRKGLLFRSSKIGDLAPLGFNYLCQQYAVTYTLLTDSEYVRLEGAALYTKAAVDRETLSVSDSFLSLGLKCSIKSSPNSVPHDFERTINITVSDRNDNGPKLQDERNWNFVLDSPHFKQNNSVGKKIIFLDADTLAVNSHLTYEIHNDTLDILRPVCDASGVQNSVISCQLIFSRNGLLRKSPYCVVLATSDVSVDSDDVNAVQANICIRTNTTKNDRPLPPQALRADSKKSKFFISSELERSSPEARSVSRPVKYVPIAYPKDIFIYRSSANLSRVIQPERMVDLLGRRGVEFVLVEDRSKAFGITAEGGIVYVRNITALLQTPEAIYFLTINSTDQHNSTFMLKVHLEIGQPPNTTCEQSKPRIRSCAQAENKKQCSKLCALGTDGGACQWRGVSGVIVSPDYASCVPNKMFCPDNICDPLESLDKFLCPQDCAPRHKIVGPHTTNKNKRGILSASGTCRCDETATCSCAATADAEVVSKPRRSGKKDRESQVQNSTPSPILVQTAASAIACGLACLALALGCPAIIGIAVICLIISRRKYLRRAKETLTSEKEKPSPEIAKLADMPEVLLENSANEKWEFAREQLVLDTILGEGEFGQVVRAYATNIDQVPGVTTVAVKKLKTGANSVEHLALLSEFQLLQEVAHPNVIKLLGACTKGESPLIIIEYAKFGSVRSYLRLSRKIESCGAEFDDGVGAVTSKDILSFAWQICKGMAYLTEIQLVHRDLAARNVLLAEGKICKISDFGLTRDVYEESAYLKRSRDRVPVKWLAPESLADNVYTSKSDVWAFGVLAWELITLGASPYPGIPLQNLYHLLRSGHRMERPENCSEEIYSLVRSCWVDDPNSRPSFKYLASQWETLLGNNAKFIEMEIENAVSNPLYCTDDHHKIVESLTSEFGEPDGIDHLWQPPKINHDVTQNSSRRQSEQTTSFDDDLIVPPGYDMPRTIVFDPQLTDQMIRYENDIRFPPKMRLAASRTSTPILDAHEYSVVVKRGQSYLDMTNQRKQINDNLDSDDIEKNLSKNISFRFSSLVHLNEQ